MLGVAEKPILLTGSGVFRSGAGEAMRRFVETTGIPFLSSPQGRGMLPDDHPLCFLGARSSAFREADVALVPTHVFKATHDFGKNESAAYLVKNTEGKSYAKISIEDLDKLAGLNVLPKLPSNVKVLDLPAPKL
jgi:thiamine pyrophosphate-dependent acetolactate synthase large subunit-like protein